MFNPFLTADEIEKVLPHLKVLQSMVNSGQGAVFKAQRAGGGQVALKIYFPNQELERAHREAVHLQNLNCPTIVNLENFGLTKLRNRDCFFTETTFEDGLDLHERLATSGKLSVQDSIRLIHDVAVALDVLWTSHRIVHCDLKPRNVLVGQNRFIVIDLGLAKYIDLPGVTPTGYWKMGTEGYMAPEQTRGRQFVTPRSDIFALGVIAYGAVTGVHPFGGRQDLINLPTFRPTNPKILVPGLPDKLNQLLAKMLAFDSLRRPAFASEILKLIQAL